MHLLIMAQNIQWYKNGSIIKAATNSNYPATSTGSYAVMITSDGKSCSDTSKGYKIVVDSMPAVNINPSGIDSII